MRILIFTTQDLFFLSHVCERATYFKEQGCIVAVAAQKTSDSYVKKIEDLGFHFFDTKIERQSINLFSHLIATWRLIDFTIKFKPDVFYNLGAKPIFLGSFIARLFGKRIGILNAPIGLGFVFASNSTKARLLRPIVLFLYKMFLNPSHSRVIVENFDDINFFIKLKAVKPQNVYCILGAGVNTSKYSPIPYSYRNPTCTVVMASRLIKEKGVEDFFQVAKMLYEKKIPIKMQLIGAPDFGNPSSISKEFFDSLKMHPSIECLGYQSDIVPFLQKAHICCLPSYYREGLPRILIEAASCGLAILTTDTIGCKEVLRNNNGFLFKPHDTKKLYELILRLSKNIDERESLGQNSRNAALQFFDTKLINERTYNVIKSLFDNNF